MPSRPKARKPVYPQRVPVVRSAGPWPDRRETDRAPRGRNDGPPSIIAPARRAAIGCSSTAPPTSPRRTVIIGALDVGPNVVGAIVRGARDLHDLEIVGILDVRLRDLALIGDAVALAHHHLAEPLEFGAKPAAHHEDQMKAGVVRVARGAAARLELLDGAADGPADAAVGRFREPGSRYSRNGRSPLRVQSVPSSRDSTILGFSVDMFPSSSIDRCGRPWWTMAACPLQSLQAHARRASTSRRLRSQQIATRDGGPTTRPRRREEDNAGQITDRARCWRAVSCRAVSARSR